MDATVTDSPTGRVDRTQVVESAIQRCNQIATLPSVVAQIIEHAEDPNSTVEQISKVIHSDPALAVRLLKLVNSTYYGLRGRVDSIERAVRVLGFHAVKNIAIAASMAKLFRGGFTCKGFDAAALWTHSIAVAIGAMLLAKRSNRAAAEEVYLAGLIHDIGIILELQSDRQRFAQMIRELEGDEQVVFRRNEEKVFGASHEDFGAGLCRAWGFPNTLAFVTGFHHRPWDLPEVDRYIPTLVHVADCIVANGGIGYARTVESTSIEPHLLEVVGLSESDLDDLVKELPNAVAQADWQ